MVYSEDLLERLRYEYKPSTHQIEVLACLSLNGSSLNGYSSSLSIPVYTHIITLHILV